LRCACLVLMLLPLAACDLQFKPGAEGLLDALNTEVAPAELAAMAMDPYDANSRYKGTMGLANAYFGNLPAYLALFSDNINDPDPAVRAAAARGLAHHGEPEHAPLLIKALSDKHKVVRLEAARGLQRLHSPAAVDPLMKAMRDFDPRDTRGTHEPEPEVRAEAADALGQYDEIRVLHALIAAMDDSDLAVSRRVLASLRTLTGQDFGLERAAWAGWLSRAKDPFAGKTLYHYPTFSRPLRMYEYIPFVPKPANEVPAPPAGVPRG
jgi:hypothetical protein